MDTNHPIDPAVRAQVLEQLADIERVVAAEGIREFAGVVFGDALAAESWLERPHQLLGNAPPNACLRQREGRMRVISILIVIRYGGVV